ncbi:MAG: aminotransferase class III-fold pyridoxal phosphate-dependent enzyme [Bryobacterales bacterium]|nr:aminotransferase class III-fold pyridoxal phosphate-dependent enzyme [Bryobacterales bacterium]
MRSFPKSEAILAHNRRFIPGGVVSVNRSVSPQIVFTRAEGALLWDAEGNTYIDYHAAFAPHFLGHNDRDVNAAVEQVLQDQASLYGAGTTVLEGELAELICTNIPWIECVQFLNTGSEATAAAIRAARAITGRDHIVTMQGGYNGWHNDVAGNLMTPLAQLGPRVSPGEYGFHPISAGIPEAHRQLVHSVNFNDLDSVRWVCERFPIAALLTEPILQNIGIVKPVAGYLEGLRALADEFGFLLLFDEVKTGFRHALGGYAGISGVQPDLAVYGKAIANGYPMAALGGKKQYMDWFVHPEAAKRVLLAGTYNAHPAPTAAAIATIRKLMDEDGEVYRQTEALGARMEKGLREAIASKGVTARVARQGSAFCIYFMDHAPVDWHDLAGHHDFAFDEAFRRRLLERGIYFFPLATKQCSISYAHTVEQIDRTVEAVEQCLSC